MKIIYGIEFSGNFTGTKSERRDFKINRATKIPKTGVRMKFLRTHEIFCIDTVLTMNGKLVMLRTMDRRLGKLSRK